MEPTQKAIDFLPTMPAKAALWLSVFLSGGLYVLLQYLQVDTLLPLAQAQKLSLLLIAGVPLLIGSYITLYFVVRAYNNKRVDVTISNLTVPKSVDRDDGPLEPDATVD